MSNKKKFKYPVSPLQRQMMIARLFVLIKQMDEETLLERLRINNHPEYRWVREFPRINCYLIADFSAKGKAYQGYIRDISASGVFIETSEIFEKSQEVSLCFTLSESSDYLPFKVKGRVTRIYPDGIGVHYETTTHYQRNIIDALIQNNT